MSKQLFSSIFCFALILTGCATVSESPVKSESAHLAEIPDKTAESTVESSVPADLLYLLLSAEIAGQKEEYDVALDGYMKAAKWTTDPKVAERATQIALFTKDQDKALEAVALWIEKQPDSAAARKIAAILNVKQGSYDQAVTQLESLQSVSDTDFGKTVMEIAQYLGKEVEKERAFDFMERLSQVLPNQPDVHYSYAMLALANNDLQRADRKISTAIVLRPDWNQAQIVQARIFAQRGEKEAAVSLLRNMVDAQPDNEKLHMIYAQFLINMNDYPAAEAALEDILANNPKQYDALYSLALVKLQNNQLDDTRELLLKLVEVPKWKEQAYFYIGRIDAKNKQNQMAISWFEKITQGPLVLDAQTNIVSLLAIENRLDEAVNKLHVLHQRFPAQSQLLSLMEAELLNQQKDYEGAFLVLSRALESEPDQPELLYTRALVAENLDRLDVLEQDLMRVLENNPDDPNALNALGYTLADRTERYEEAQRYLDRAIQLKPDDPVIMDSYGWLQYRLGDLAKAIDYLQRAYDLNKDSEIAAHLGEVLWELGREDEAKSVWLNGLSSDPDSKHLLEIKQRFRDAFSE